jgi:sporulation protein YunB
VRRFRDLRLDRIPGRAVRWLRLPVLVLAVLFLLGQLGDLILSGHLEMVAQMEAQRLGAEAIGQVAVGRVGEQLRREDLVRYEKDSAGRIAAYQLNTQLINRVAAETAKAVQQELRRLSDSPFGVPLGAATGSTLLSSLGPRIPVRLIPIGAVTVDIRQDFRGDGINQTRHRIWLQVTADIRIAFPLSTREAPISQEIPISETVIIGPVPESFFGSDLGRVTVPAR